MVRCVENDQISLPLGSPQLAAFAPRAWVAGAAGAPVSLRWETWEPASGWVAQAPSAPFAIVDTVIDPDAVAGATLQNTALPFTDRAGQMLLHAERSFVRFDGVVLTLRSNPVLLTLFEVAP